MIPAPQPTMRTERGFGMDQGRDVAEHPLEPHVGRIARGLDLAADVEIAGPVGELDDGDRGVHPFPDVQGTAVADLGEEVPAPGDELPGDIGHGEDEDQGPGDEPGETERRNAGRAPGGGWLLGRRAPPGLSRGLQERTEGDQTGCRGQGG